MDGIPEGWRVDNDGDWAQAGGQFGIRFVITPHKLDYPDDRLTVDSLSWFTAAAIESGMCIAIVRLSPPSKHVWTEVARHEDPFVAWAAAELKGWVP